MSASVPIRGVAVLLIACLGASACTPGGGDDPAEGEPTPTTSAIPDPAGVPHEFVDDVPGLPDQFPDFPPEATPFGIILTETTNSSDDTLDLLQRRRAAAIPNSDDVNSVWAYYRDTLPTQGWSAGEISGHQLLFSGYDAEGTIAATVDSSRVLITISVWVPHPSLDQQPAVLAPVPDWFQDSLPELPERAERVKAELQEGYSSPTTGDQGPTTLRVQYRLRGEPAVDDFAGVVAHMREATPHMGWTFLEEQDRSEEREQGDQVIVTEHVTLHYQGNGAYLTVHVLRWGIEDFDLHSVEVTLEYMAQPTTDPE